MRTKLLSFKSLLMICLLAIVGGAQAWAQTEKTATFVFNTPEGLAALKIDAPALDNGTDLGTNTYTIDDITMSSTDGSGTKNRIYNSRGKYDLRVYKNGGSLTFTAAKGFEISKINFTGTANLSDVKSNVWSGTASESVKLTAKGTCKIETAVITYKEVSSTSVSTPTITPASQAFKEPFTATISCATSGAAIYYTVDGTDPTTSSTRTAYTEAGVQIPAQTTTLKACAELNGEKSSVVTATYTYLPTYENLAALKAVAQNGQTYTVKLIDAVVTKVNGYNCYIQDATAGILYYKKNHGYKEGQKLNGAATVTYNVVNDQIEITSLDGDITVTSDAEIPCKEVELSDLLKNFNEYESMRVKIPMGIVTKAFKNQNGEITDGSNIIVVYNGYKSTTFDAFRQGAYVDVIGYPCTYNSTKEIKVWTGDITAEEYKETVNVSDAQYATYYGADAFFMPTGMTGSIVVKDGDCIKLNETFKEGDLVPAKTALVLNAPKAKYDLYLGETEETAPADNLLHGTIDEDITNAGEGNYLYYKLSYDNKGENLGFYWGEDNGSEFINGAHKAYLALPVVEGQSMAKGFSLNDLANGTVTGVNAVNVNAENAAKVVYDLNGRRINNLNAAAKGVYIVNGKKVLVK